MPRQATHKRWSADDSADVAAILLQVIAGIVFAFSMKALLVPLVDAALFNLTVAIAGGTTLALAYTACRRRGARESKGLHSSAPGASEYILISYGLVADEWENLRGIAALVPKKRSDDTLAIQRPAEETGEAMFRPEAGNSHACGGSADPDKRPES